MKLSKIQAAGVMPVNKLDITSAAITLTNGQWQQFDEGKAEFIEYNGSHYQIKGFNYENNDITIERIEVER